MPDAMQGGHRVRAEQRAGVHPGVRAGPHAALRPDRVHGGGVS